MITEQDRIEFYEADSKRPFLIMRSSFAPSDGDKLSIGGITYNVLGRSFTVDYVGDPGQSIRCNVIVEKSRK